MAVDNLSTRFYVYVHRRRTDNTVFYVGKGCGRRYLKTQGRSAFWQNIVNKHGFSAEIVQGNFTEAQAISLEIELIKHYGRENLCNLTDGGEGMAGHEVGQYARTVISLTHKGRKRSKETCDAISASLKGRALSLDARQKISAKLKGQVLSESTRKAMSIARSGKKHTEEWKANIAKAWQLSPERYAERCKAMSEAKAKVAVACIETGAIFNSMKDAIAWLRTSGHEKAHHGTISLCCTGKRNTAYGYRWRYAE